MRSERASQFLLWAADGDARYYQGETVVEIASIVCGAFRFPT